MRAEFLAHWFNGSWDAQARRDVWVERLDDGRYQSALARRGLERSTTS